MVFCQNDANGIANSEDPDQTAPIGSLTALIGSLIWVCTVCSDLSVRKLRVITVKLYCYTIQFSSISKSNWNIICYASLTSSQYMIYAKQGYMDNTIPLLKS